MFSSVFFSLFFLWVSSSSSFSSLPRSSTRVLGTGSHSENPPKRNAWMNALLNLPLCGHLFVHWFSVHTSLGRNRTRVYETCFLWPFIMKLPPFFWGGPTSLYSTLACSLCPASVTSFTLPGVQNQLGERNEPPLYEWLKTSVVRQLKFLAMQGNRSGAMAEWWPLWAWFCVFFCGKNVSGV